MNQFLQNIDSEVVTMNILIIYGIFQLIGDDVVRLFNTKCDEGRIKKVITIIVSFVSGTLYYYLKQVELHVIVTSVITSCVLYDYAIKYLFKLINSKLHD